MLMQPDEIQNLKAMQKVNWMPGMPELSFKHLLHKNIATAKARFGDAPFSFWPQGWVLPDDYSALEAHYQTQEDGINQFPIILKPSMAACGNGIRCITAIDQLPVDDPFLKFKSVAQHYIPNPLLLDGYKVTFRIYVLLASIAPLRAYIFPNGLGRICSHRYTTELASFQDLFAHLTNYDINKHNIDEFMDSKGDGMNAEGLKTDGLRTDFVTVMEYLQRKGHDTDALWEKMKVATARTLLSSEPKIASAVLRNCRWRSTTFEILGFDFLIDEDMNPWILEVNHSPNLEPHTPLETDIKRAMIRETLLAVDVLHLDGGRLFHSTNAFMQALEELKKREISLDTLVPLTNGRGEQEYFALSSLDRLAVWNLFDAQCASQRLGQWQPVFPTSTSEQDCTLPTVEDGTPITLYREGPAGPRNDALVKLIQTGLSMDNILVLLQNTLACNN